ncbi:glycosyltransferase [Fulvivirga sp. 29W222]|uniref:Glycosyltransferase n=1 Tax=Fulvivirga marina TaxID=2494733 RepID=A0A937G0D5_9BACT|nr:glycosyltransferase [Fulvivirga marina]MBL6448327.1 glycosyltransferase [Fulvivirga marina]
MSVVLIIIVSVYCLLLVVLNVGWVHNKSIPTYVDKLNHHYSVIVPFRNEQTNLRRLLNSLQSQNFPGDSYEVILVNDHSDDLSVEIINEFVPKVQSWSLLHLEAEFGKKQALLRGIQSSKGSVIVTTDADCSMGEDWLMSIASYYESTDAHMVTGPVTFERGTTFFERLQTIEFASLIGTGAASLALGIPNMCNGANLSFLKASFFKVGGYKGNEQIPSGDDEFLMHKFWEVFRGKVYFNRSKDAVVRTLAHAHWSNFFQQRKRWASKWKFYSSKKTTLLAAFVLVFNMSFILALMLLILDLKSYRFLLGVVFFKMILEAYFLYKVLNFLDKRLNLFLFAFLQFTYPIYVVIFGIAANFGEYRWKGRKH